MGPIMTTCLMVSTILIGCAVAPAGLTATDYSPTSPV